MENDDGSPKTTVKIEIRGSEEGGSPWNDGVYSTVRRLLINHREWICSIHVEYDKNGKSDWGSKHGGNEGYTSEVVLDYPNEYLISICGYYGNIRKWRRIDANVIRSLTLHTNRRTYGPFGMEEGTRFSFPIMGAKIVGFHGRCGWFLDAIGLYIQPIPKNQLKNVSLAPCGGKGGDPWEYVFRAIRKLVITHEQWIYSIEMLYEDKNGKLVWSKNHGSRDGSSRSEVVLEFPDEYFVTVHGYYGDLHNFGDAATVIRSLTLETNRRTYGPFGVEDGTKFSFPIMGTRIVGFHGRSGWYLDAIGLYLGTPQKRKLEPQLQLKPEPEPKHSSFGPYGGVGGDSWDETFWTIRRLVIYHGLCIDSIQMEYEDENGTIMLSKKHGGNGGSRSEIFLDFPNEHLVSIHGYYSDIWGPSSTVIRSLTLKTNKRTYGPFGMEEGTRFSFPIMGAKIVGFHGRCGWFLDAIGVHVQTIQKNGLGSEKISLEECGGEAALSSKKLSLGEYGGEGGAPWNEGFRKIKQLVIYHGLCVDSIQMEYEDEKEELVWSEKHGGNGGSRSEVVLEYPDEDLVTIHGYYDDVGYLGYKCTVIRSLTVETNKRTYGPFGVEDGTVFSFPTAGMKVVGIHGRSGVYLDAIGLYAIAVKD